MDDKNGSINLPIQEHAMTMNATGGITPETSNLQYLRNNVQYSKFPDYPDRFSLIDGKFRIFNSNGNIIIKIKNDHPLLNRVRTGHTCA